MNYRTVGDHQGEISLLIRGHIAGQLSSCAHLLRPLQFCKYEGQLQLCSVMHVPEFLTKS